MRRFSTFRPLKITVAAHTIPPAQQLPIEVIPFHLPQYALYCLHCRVVLTISGLAAAQQLLQSICHYYVHCPKRDFSAGLIRFAAYKRDSNAFTRPFSSPLILPDFHESKINAFFCMHSRAPAFFPCSINNINNFCAQTYPIREHPRNITAATTKMIRFKRGVLAFFYHKLYKICTCQIFICTKPR